MPKTVYITGAHGGIGRHVTSAFADADWNLALVEYSSEDADALRDAYPDALVLQADLSDEDEARRTAEKTQERFGGIDVAVALVGGFGMESAVEATAGQYDRMFDLNVRTLFNTARAVLPSLQEQQGLLVGTSAGAASGAGGMALYAASKAAVAAYLASLADEFSGEGVRVTTLAPQGAVDTSANHEAMPDADPRTWVDPEAIAQHLLRLAEAGPRGHLRRLEVHAEPPADA